MTRGMVVSCDSVLAVFDGYAASPAHLDCESPALVSNNASIIRPSPTFMAPVMCSVNAANLSSLLCISMSRLHHNKRIQLPDFNELQYVVNLLITSGTSSVG